MVQEQESFALVWDGTDSGYALNQKEINRNKILHMLRDHRLVGAALFYFI